MLLLRSTAPHKQWELPGGLINMDESFAEGLIREFKEETTLDVTVGDPIWASDDWRKNFKFNDGSVRDARVVEVMYLCTMLSEKDIVLSDEHSEYKWATSDDVDSLPMFLYQSRPLKERVFI